MVRLNLHGSHLISKDANKSVNVSERVEIVDKNKDETIPCETSVSTYENPDRKKNLHPEP